MLYGFPITHFARGWGTERNYELSGLDKASMLCRYPGVSRKQLEVVWGDMSKADFTDPMFDPRTKQIVYNLDRSTVDKYKHIYRLGISWANRREDDHPMKTNVLVSSRLPQAMHEHTLRATTGT